MLKNLKTAILLATVMVAFAPALARAGERTPIMILNETGGPAARVNTDGSLAVGLSSTAASATVTIVDGGGSITIDDGGGALTVDGSLTGVTTVGTITNPVKITDNGGSITVDGTFWQSTQPVSGTFWQATQPVSGTVTATITALTDTEYEYATVAATTPGTVVFSSAVKRVMVCSICGGNVTVRIDGGAGTGTSGIPLFGNACVNFEDGAITDIDYYNLHSAQCEIFVQGRR
jgi:hypothetical protein